MKDRLGVPNSRSLADFLPTITHEHVANSSEVRKLLGELGMQPEALPPAEDVKHVEKRLGREQGRLRK